MKADHKDRKEQAEDLEGRPHSDGDCIVIGGAHGPTSIFIAGRLPRSAVKMHLRIVITAAAAFTAGALSAAIAAFAVWSVRKKDNEDG